MFRPSRTSQNGSSYPEGIGWPPPPGQRRGATQSSDSDTEREFNSASLSDPSARLLIDSELNGDDSPAENANSSVDILPESSPSAPYWSVKRHLTCGNPTPGPPWSQQFVPWRGSAPGKLKTANAALVLCLNIDVDPPDVVKTNPCAMLESWVNPHTLPSHKALEAIGSNLQHQFEGLSLKIAYKPILDPSLEDLRRFCQTLRRQAKDDAVLFYYNGHGVPKPTSSGELWCFNRNYTQYIPVSLQEVQSWIGSPGVYIWDCSAAGHLLSNFNTFARRRDQEARAAHGEFPEGVHPFTDSLQLAACGPNEQLPSCPELPADVFTACLTSPIDIALRYFIMNNVLPNGNSIDMVIQLPGDLKDRRTPLGELNWIFTAITDTIAWTTFPRDIFVKLYRSDLLIASLFRNFLLAERVMKNYHCTPITEPRLPPTNTHPLWDTWDLAVDACLRQLPELLYQQPELKGGNLAKIGVTPDKIGQPGKDPFDGLFKPLDAKPYVYIPNRFFADQLTAFEVWISRGGSALTKRGPMALPLSTANDDTTSSILTDPSTNNSRVDTKSSSIFTDKDTMSERTLEELRQMRPKLDGLNDQQHLVPRKPPDQLPIVLQVLLSQPHRLRALILLSQFVDLGPWAVHLVLTIGIFPYISKLLQAAGQDLRPVLIFIWARILAVDQSVQADLFNSSGFKYFSTVLGLKNDDVLPNSSEHKAMCSFILAAVSRDFPHGQAACWAERVFDNCYDRLEEPDFLLRQWTALCIAQMWAGNDEIKVYGVDHGTQDKLIRMLADDSAEVRSAALYALGTFMGASGSADEKKPGGGGTGTMYQLDERVHFRMEVAVATGATLAIKDDASPMCRKELLVVISCLVKEWRGYFVVCAWLYWEEDRRWRNASSTNTTTHTSASASASYGMHNSTAYIQDDDMTNQAVSEWLDSFGGDEMLREENRVLLSSFFTIFVVLLDLSVDPYAEVATMAQTIVDYIMALLLESPFTKLEFATLDKPPSVPIDKRSGVGFGAHGSGSLGVRGMGGSVSSPHLGTEKSRPNHPGSTTAVIAPPSPSPSSTTMERPPLLRSDTLPNPLTGTLKRTSSFANVTSSFIKSFAFPSSTATGGTGSAGVGGEKGVGIGVGVDENGRSTLIATSLSSGGTGFSSGGSAEVNDANRGAPPPNLNFAKYESPYYVPNYQHQSRLNSSASQHPYHASHPTNSRKHPSDSHYTTATTTQMHTPHDFQPYHVMEALMEEDMERLRARRRTGLYPRHRGSGGGGASSSHSHSHSHGAGGSSHGHTHTGGGSMPSPSNSTFSRDSGDSNASSVILGLGTGSGVRDVLPLRSTYYDWCCEYFKEPQMRQTEAEEPGSMQYNYQMWRLSRNEKVTSETKEQAVAAEFCRWDRPVATIQTSGHPLTMAFHSFDQQLVVANETDSISVYDWSTRKRLSQWCNGNPRGTSITSIIIINQDVGGIIVVGSAEGIVRLYRNFDPVLEQGPVQIVSAFRALNEVIQSRQGTGLVMDWKQSAGTLLAGGDSRVIKVWDAQTETQGLDLDTNSESPVTAISSDMGNSQTFAASFADGMVKIFDRRIEDEDSIVRTYSDHTAWVQNVRWHARKGYQLMSASVDGQIKLWDMRGPPLPIKTSNIQPQGLAAFDAHPLTDVSAASSSVTSTNWRAQKIVVNSLNQEESLSSYHLQTGLTMAPLRTLPSPFILRLSSLTFHPKEMLYGLGQPDGTIRVMGCKLSQPEFA
ncbi:WD repeat-containing protein mip1 [Leucoagaricus sp. SymC.cos]|nr:WD repeat-containing protein mip1 [Leucoagaricus sp. SymC.cos]